MVTDTLVARLKALTQEMRTADVEADSLAYYADMIDRELRGHRIDCDMDEDCDCAAEGEEA